MTAPSWQISGQYYETCNCDFVCPCVPGGLTVSPSKGNCTFAMAYQIERGSFGRSRSTGSASSCSGTPRAPWPMATGRWASLPMTVPPPSSATRSRRLSAAALVALWRRRRSVKTCLGVEPATITFQRDGRGSGRRGYIDMAAEGAKGLNPNAPEPLHLDHSGHPAADRFELARASRSHVHALGLDWDDVSGKNNGQYAPFSWRSA